MMNNKVIKEIRYNGKTYKIFECAEDDWDVPMMCSDGRKVYPYEDEALEVFSKGEVILDKTVDL